MRILFPLPSKRCMPILILSIVCPGFAVINQSRADEGGDISAEILEELRAVKARVRELEQKLKKAEQQASRPENGDEADSPEVRIIRTDDEDEEAPGQETTEAEVVETDLNELASVLETRIMLGSTYRSEVEELITTKAQQVYAQREAQKAEDTIRVHGAARGQLSYEDFNAGNRDRAGDFDFDMLRINLDGAIDDVLFSAEYRFYQYMNTIHHAWIGYDFTDTFQGQAGIHQVPFGILPFNSHNYFFSSNFYLGLEDDYDMGVKFIYDDAPLNLQAAFYKNDEQGGVDGFVDNRSDRYSYDVVGFRGSGEGIFADPANPVAETNTFNGRAVYIFEHADNYATKIGVSGQYGKLHDSTSTVGDNSAYAVHLNGFYDRWNLQLQAAQYEYDMDSGAQTMAVGAFSFFDTIPAEATIYTGNLSYSMPVDYGPISNITFYNDYSLVTDKSAGLSDTWMNVSGFSVTAGGLFAYFDFVMARNQPFIGSSLANDADDTNARFNINLGYYF